MVEKTRLCEWLRLYEHARQQGHDHEVYRNHVVREKCHSKKHCLTICGSSCCEQMRPKEQSSIYLSRTMRCYDVARLTVRRRGHRMLFEEHLCIDAQWFWAFVRVKFHRSDLMRSL